MMSLARFERALKAAGVSLALSPLLLLMAALAWSVFAPDRLYHCWDDLPLLACIPPFVHLGVDTGALRDYYIWPAWSVYLLWFAVIAGTVLIPTLIGWWASQSDSFQEDPDVA